MSSITHAVVRTRRWHVFGRNLEGSFCRVSVMIIFYHHRRQLRLAPRPSTHHVDNVSTPAISTAHSAQYAQFTNLSPGPLALCLPPRQHQFQTSTQRSTTREAYTLQPTISSRSSTSPQQTTCLSSPLECQREGTAEEEAISPHDASRRNLFPLVPHESHHSRVDHHGEAA